MKNFNEFLKEIESNLDQIECNGSLGKANEEWVYRCTDLKLKYAMVILLKDINHNLYEISHYGIGTD
jgi:hypothetical protein